MPATPEEIEQRLRKVEAALAKQETTLVPVKAAGTGIGMVGVSGDTDLTSAGFVQMKVGGKVCFVPYFGKVE